MKNNKMNVIKFKIRIKCLSNYKTNLNKLKIKIRTKFNFWDSNVKKKNKQKMKNFLNNNPLTNSTIRLLKR